MRSDIFGFGFPWVSPLCGGGGGGGDGDEGADALASERGAGEGVERASSIMRRESIQVGELCSQRDNITTQVPGVTLWRN